jgi:hypothetical protein
MTHRQGQRAQRLVDVFAEHAPKADQQERRIERRGRRI